MLLNCFQHDQPNSGVNHLANNLDEPGSAADRGRELGIKELVQRLGLPQTVVSRLAATLVEYGYLYQNPTTRKYRLGLTAFTLGMAANPHEELKRAAWPWMEQLARETGESVSLTVVDPVSNDGLCIASIDSANTIKLTTVVGSMRPLHRGATRKVLLAYLPPDQQRSYMPRVRASASSSDLSTPSGAETGNMSGSGLGRVLNADLQCELEQIVQDGYAYSEEELDKGAFAIAAPIRTERGLLLGGVAVLGPIFRHTTEERKSWIPLVQRAAEAIVRSLRQQ